MAWIVYAAVFIYLTSAVVGGVRYFLLFDDEMISMRYAAISCEIVGCGEYGAMKPTS